MFTGIVEQTGLIRSTRLMSGGRQLEIDLGRLAEGTKIGDSISISGVCLTVSKLDKTIALFDISEETLRRSTLVSLQTGSVVNLERAMGIDGRFGGHFVQGHVDGVGKIASIRKQAQFAEFRIEAPAQLLGQMVEKGSVAVDGISLTVASLDKSGFTVAVIPTTLDETTWKDSKPGDSVNIETDILVKIIQKQLKNIGGENAPLSMDKLKEMGF